jgi:hypothetical protein
MTTNSTRAPGAHPSHTPSATDLNLFMDRLLAPVTEGEEQPDTPAFRKLIERDMYKVWSRAMEAVQVAAAHHTIAAIAERNSGDGLSTKGWDAWARRLDAERAQCLVPAPTMKEVRWKKRLLPTLIRETEVAAAIAADEARLQGGCNV